jgi:hypothetical protein
MPGELLRETAKNGQRAKAGGTGRNQSQKSHRTTSAPQLKDHGISKDQSSDWQKLPENETLDAAASTNHNAVVLGAFHPYATARPVTLSRVAASRATYAATANSVACNMKSHSMVLS